MKVIIFVAMIIAVYGWTSVAPEQSVWGDMTLDEWSATHLMQIETDEDTTPPTYTGDVSDLYGHWNDELSLAFDWRQSPSKGLRVTASQRSETKAAAVHAGLSLPQRSLPINGVGPLTTLPKSSLHSTSWIVTLRSMDALEPSLRTLSCGLPEMRSFLKRNTLMR